MAITIGFQPAPIQPVFNQIFTTFTSDNSALQGFRYLVDIYATDTNTLISQQKIVPQLDASGKVDISRILANYVSVDFAQFLLVTDPATNSFFNYTIQVGEEYTTPAWEFTTIRPLLGTPQYTILSGTTTPPYVVNDQILIATTATTNPLYGLHKVISSGTNFVGVNVLYTGGVGTFSATTGSTVYADGRKTAFSGLTALTGLTVFNGVKSFAEFINYSSNSVNVGTPNTIRKMLTDLPVTNFYASSGQTLWFNVMITKTNPYNYCLVAESSNSASAITQCVSANDLREVVQFPFNFDDTGFDLDTTDWVDLYIGRTSGATTERLTIKYRVFLDRRCTINDYEIAFMDRMGSIGSFKFQLRAKQTGTIERVQYKKEVGYPYDTIDKGTTNIWIGVQKDLELNTDWMTEEMNVYFEQLLSSPNTWIKNSENESFYACTITDVAFEIEFQKNKRLIRKTIKIRYANNDAVNI